jgi:putative membrane protein
MLTLLVKWFLSALALFLVGNFLPGIHVPSYGTALIVAAVLGVVNVTLRPILKIIAFPITIITLGLFAFIVNGFTFWLVAKMLDGFSVDSFWWAVLGALIVSIVTAVLHRIVLGSDGEVGGE